MERLVSRTLVSVHRRVQRHPMVHRVLAKVVDHTVGEKLVKRALLKTVMPGDCVWDVGANVGSYTRQLIERVGVTGHVVAFEPIPDNAAQLRTLGPRPELTVIEAALADVNGETSLQVSGRSGETSRIGEANGDLTVRVTRGDTVIEGGAPKPVVIKIDVEGSEGDVIDGMPNALSGVRTLVVEVHFATLAERGKPNEPARILELLKSKGFSVRWIDSAHFLANRPLHS